MIYPWRINRGEVRAFPPREFNPMNIPKDESEGTMKILWQDARSQSWLPQNSEEFAVDK
jgi:hypothetical protein